MTIQAPEEAGIARFVPAFGWLRSYDRAWLAADLLAGATAAAVVIPQAMGYATVAGLPVEIGLYTCIFPMLIYALFGTARRLSFSTTSTIVALTGLAITAAAPDSTNLVGTATTLTLMVGLLLIVFRLIRLGWMLEAVSEATLAGLKVGVGLTIIADQLPKLLGIPSTEGDFFGDVWNAIEQLPEANLTTALIGGITIAFLLVLRAWKPKIPGPLLALAVGIGLVVFTGVTDRGVATIPEVPTGLPLPAIPPFQHLEALLPFALAIALMSYFETVTAGRIARQPDDPPIDNDQEYIADRSCDHRRLLLPYRPPCRGVLSDPGQHQCRRPHPAQRVGDRGPGGGGCPVPGPGAR